MRGVAILHGVLNGKALAALVPQFVEAQRAAGHPRQSGISLDRAPFANSLLKPLAELARLEFGCDGKILFDKSSCRVQEPSGEAHLGVHQDGAAVAGCITFWCPLTPITPRSPSIGFWSGRDMPLLEHETDENGYLVVREWDWQLTPVHGIGPGDAVLMAANAVHATYIPPGAEGTRVSFDVRVVRA